MELQTALENRRSIRKYDGSRKVTKEQLEMLITAALDAPTWKNTETARFYIALSEETDKKIREECLPEFNAKRTAGATLIVATFVKDLSGFNNDGTPTNEAGNGWGYYDLGFASQDLLLKAYDMGLGTLVMGIRDADKLREILEIPESELVGAVIAVGYPDISPDKPARKAVGDVVKYY